MHLLDVIHRDSKPQPWGEGESIPWNDPDFSVRMLREHLSQAHDAASRRLKIIEQHVDWIHQQVLAERPSRILDLACGPGLYTSLLAKRGHTCVGIDFSPASIDYARTYAHHEGLNCTYKLEDVRTADFGSDFDLVMMVYGQFNTFRPEDADTIVEKSGNALVGGGVLLLEPFLFSAARELGIKPPEWWTSDGGLFSDRPHLVLRENFWDGLANVAINRYYALDGATSEVSFFTVTTKAYTQDEYQHLLESHGFQYGVTFTPAAEVSPAQPESEFQFITATTA
jgi:SAM-dependent methyltransferase